MSTYYVVTLRDMGVISRSSFHFCVSSFFQVLTSGCQASQFWLSFSEYIYLYIVMQLACEFICSSLVSSFEFI